MSIRIKSELTGISGGQALYVLERMLEERVIVPGQLTRYLSDMAREIRELEARLEMLRESAGLPARPPEAPAPKVRRDDIAVRRARHENGDAKPGGEPVRRRQNLSPERRERLKLQGQFMALLRRFPAPSRARYKELAKSSGIEAAIRGMEEVRGKPSGAEPGSLA